MQTSTIVLDAGSGTVKVGSSTSPLPIVIPSLAGRAKYKPLFQISPQSSTGDNIMRETTNTVVGIEAAERRGLLHLSYPIQHGSIVDWDAWQLLLTQSSQQLNTPLAEKNMFWIEHPFSSRPQRARVAQILFEEHNSAGMSVGIAPLLSLYATGKTTGIVLDIGEGVSSVAAAVQGYALTEMMQRVDFGGGAVTQYLQRLMREYGSYYNAYSGTNNNNNNHHNNTVVRSFNPSRSGAERELVRTIKEDCCEVSPTPISISPAAVGNWNNTTNLIEKDNTRSENDAMLLGLIGAVSNTNTNNDTPITTTTTTKSTRHRLPDGTELTLGCELQQAAEVLFTPALIGHEHAGVADLVADAVRIADVELRAELCQCVYITGGATLLNGFGQRFLAELLQRTPRGCTVRVAAAAAEERRCAAWMGAACVAQLSTFDAKMIVRREEYMEEGERVLNSRIVG